MSRRNTKHFKSSILGGFGKRGVVEYIDKMHQSHKTDIEAVREEASALRQTADALQAECAALRDKLRESPEDLKKPAEAPPAPPEKTAEKAAEPVCADIAPLPDTGQAMIISELEEELVKLGAQLDVQINQTAAAKKESELLRQQVAALSAEQKQQIGQENRYESLLYHRAEEIEREASYNAAQTRLAADNMIRELEAVLKGIKAQTEQETSQVAARANVFLELLASMPDLFETVADQFEDIRPKYVATPMIDIDD